MIRISASRITLRQPLTVLFQRTPRYRSELLCNLAGFFRDIAKRHRCDDFPRHKAQELQKRRSLPNPRNQRRQPFITRRNASVARKVVIRLNRPELVG